MKRKKILLVDDEEDFARMVQLNLESTGKYEVVTEDMGEGALFRIKKFKPDLILLDLVMPGMDGSIIAQHIKEDESIKNIPIVFLTALLSKDDDYKSKVVGGHRFISKPVNIKELIDCIEASIFKNSS